MRLEKEDIVSDKNIGEAIMESVSEGVERILDESMNEIAMAKEIAPGVKMESYGTPKIKGDTIRIPVVVACVIETDDAGNYEKIDQAFLDKNRDLVLQKLVLQMNPLNNNGYGRGYGGMIFFDPENFKMEFVEGGVVKLTTIIVCDLSPIISEMRGLRWKLENCIRMSAQKVMKR